MILRNVHVIRPFCILWAAAAMVAAGCGEDDGIGTRYPVSGSVTYQGKPVETGNISFIPEKSDEGRVATGRIVDGSYSLTTLANDNGALPGSYKVTVTAKKQDANAKIDDKKFGGARNPANIMRVAKAAKDLVPAKYSSPTTTDLTAVVKEQSNSIDFSLND